MTAHIINALLLAGGAILLILTGVIALYAKRSARRDKARCNYRVGDVYHEVLPSTGCEDLYRMYMELQQRITVLEKDYYNRLAQQRRARQEMIHRHPAPVPGVRKENQDNRAGTR
nr:MAG TPA: shock protein B [Caudoviricetes sp.]